MIGQQVGNYEFIEQIGSGGFGEVYRAHERPIEREVAIKVILPEHAAKPEFQQRFENEARLVAKLEHPHIIPLYNFWQNTSGAFLVMRYVQGGSLREILRKQGALSFMQTTRIIGHIAEALTAAHEAGVVHRDLKPENILLDIRGNAYLTDFGIAKQVTGHQPLTDTNGLLGTMAYLSPEQLQGEPASPQSDIYALGIILYEVLAGEHPFADAPIGTLIIKQMQEPLPSVTVKRPDLPQGVNTVIARATAKFPHQRYPTAQTVIAELVQLITENPATLLQPEISRSSTPSKITTSIDSLNTLTAIVPTPPTRRSRYAMLQNVRKFWVEGVLENSLHGVSLIELGLEPVKGVVEHPWDTHLLTPSGDEHVLPRGTRIRDVFDRLNGKLLILGDPGSGKTTTLLDLTHDLLRRAEQDHEHPIPVVFNLSSWSESCKPLEDWLADELNSKYHLSRKVAARWIEEDALLLLLDGLDEVALEQRNACVEAINFYRNEHGFVDVVICSRIIDYEVLSSRLHLNGAVLIRSLEDGQIDSYLSHLGPEVSSLREFLARDDQLRELAQSPLMLSVMVMAFRGVSVSEMPELENLETQRRYLFERYVNRMFNRVRMEKLYSLVETERYLSWLAKRMTQDGMSIFNIEDLQPDWLQKGQYRLYRTLLSCILILLCSLPVVTYLLYLSHINGSLFWGVAGTISIIFGGVILDWGIGSKYLKPWHSYLGIAGAFVILSAIGSRMSVTSETILLRDFFRNCVFAFFTIYIVKRQHIQSDSINATGNLTFSWRNVTPWMIVAGFFTGITLGQMDSLVGALGGGIIVALGFVLVGGLGFTELSKRFEPNQGISNAHRNSIRIAPLASIILGLAVIAPSLIANTDITVSALRAFSIFSWLSVLIYIALGGYAVIQHYTVRRILYWDGVIPYHYARFLDYAASLILLRKVGGGYIFVHRYLLEYFAAQE